MEKAGNAHLKQIYPYKDEFETIKYTTFFFQAFIKQTVATGATVDIPW